MKPKTESSSNARLPAHQAHAAAGAPCPHEIAPVPPFLIVFNAAESFGAYRLAMTSRLPLVTMMSFPGATFPCTIGVAFDDWNEPARTIYEKSGGYILSRAEKYLSDTSGGPLAEMLSNPQVTLNNPFDPIAVAKLAMNESGNVAIEPLGDGGMVQTFDGEAFSSIRSAGFDFSHHQYPKDVEGIRDNPDVGRVIDLACLNAIAELFVEGEWKFIGTPDFVRMCAGVIRSSNYKDFSDLVQRLTSPVTEIVGQYICYAAGSIQYDHIVRLARGVAISDEIDNVPLSLERWQQLLDAEQLGATEKVRQFELEMTTFQVRNGQARI
jgi:hypothetical protein